MQFQVFQDETGFETLAEEWEGLLHRSDTDTIFLTREWLQSWWRSFSSGRELLLLSAREDGTLVGIVPLFRQRMQDGRTVMKLVGGKDVCDYLDIIALPDSRGQVYQAVFEFLISDAQEWDEIILHCVPADSPHEILRRAASQQSLIVQRHVEDVCPIIPLPDSWEDYLMMLDKKQRHELRRKIRRAEREAKVQWYITSDPDRLSEDVEAFFDLHRKSSPDKEDFMGEPEMQEFFQQVARSSLDRGWLELSFLLINGKRAATMFCFAYNNQTLVYNSGYDPAQFRHLSPGIVLMGYHIKDSIAKGRTAFDFLRGDEVYKYRFGGQNTEVFQVTIRRDE